jgi:ornithine cyclodeaminase/alanine dehydrogenase-like protein (mu-crystallin family)
MAIIITDDDARKNLSMAECIQAMQVAFRDYADGKAKTLPRARYQVDTPDPNRKYLCNVHVGAVPSYGMACVRAGSLCMLIDPDNPDRKIKQNPEPVNWTVIVLYDLMTAEPLAFVHESHLSGIRVGATSGAGIDAVARDDVTELGLFGTGRQARSALDAVCAVRPIKRVRLYSPNADHCRRFVELKARPGLTIDIVRDPQEVVAGADIIYCASNANSPLFDGNWLEPGQMVISIVNSDVNMKRSEVDETTFARATDIIVNDWESVVSNGQIELLDAIEKGTVDQDSVVELGDVLTGTANVRQTDDNLVYFKNNTGLGMQFAAAGAVIYNKIKDQKTNREVPREWLASEDYAQS